VVLVLSQMQWWLGCGSYPASSPSDLMIMGDEYICFTSIFA